MSAQAKRLAGGLLTGIGEGILLKAANVEARQAEARKNAALYGGRTAGDKRLVDEAVARYTTETFDGDVVDTDSVGSYLMDIGRPDLAQLYAPTANKPIDRDSDEWLDAGIQAEAEMNEKAGYFSTDKTDFADSDGSRTRFKTERQLELYNERTGRTGKKSGGLAQPSAAPGSGVAQAVAPDPTQTATPKMTGLALTPAAAAPTAPKPATVSGSGTRDDPYKPSAGQSDADWFEANAKAGEVIEIHGQLYENGPDGLKKAGPNAGTGRKYKTEDEVGKAHQRGEISEAEGLKILREQFGYD